MVKKVNDVRYLQLTTSLSIQSLLLVSYFNKSQNFEMLWLKIQYNEKHCLTLVISYHDTGPVRHGGVVWYPALSEFLGFVVQCIHHLAHVLYGLQGVSVCLVDRCLIKHDQHACPLVKDTYNYCIPNLTNTQQSLIFSFVITLHKCEGNLYMYIYIMYVLLKWYEYVLS